MPYGPFGADLDSSTPSAEPPVSHHDSLPLSQNTGPLVLKSYFGNQLIASQYLRPSSVPTQAWKGSNQYKGMQSVSISLPIHPYTSQSSTGVPRNLHTNPIPLITNFEEFTKLQNDTLQSIVRIRKEVEEEEQMIEKMRQIRILACASTSNTMPDKQPGGNITDSHSSGSLTDMPQLTDTHLGKIEMLQTFTGVSRPNCYKLLLKNKWDVQATCDNHFDSLKDNPSNKLNSVCSDFTEIGSGNCGVGRATTGQSGTGGLVSATVTLPDGSKIIEDIPTTITVWDLKVKLYPRLPSRHIAFDVYYGSKHLAADVYTKTLQECGIEVADGASFEIKYL